jgi:hypothetical protein
LEPGEVDGDEKVAVLRDLVARRAAEVAAVAFVGERPHHGGDERKATTCRQTVHNSVKLFSVFDKQPIL